MIELVSAERCTGCNICVHACPTGVFDATPNGIPAIARQDDCQTCFMCELYCPEDALFVSPMADAPEAVDEHTLLQRGLLGSYRQAIGWGRGREPVAALDHSHHLLLKAR